ncbi:hypothetical protein FB451DRAFT_1190238 [Mycena latifolia]|nr:hypothetical protein FB451DRAFT_1190238 [Mycena latifolia]
MQFSSPYVILRKTPSLGTTAQHGHFSSLSSTWHARTSSPSAHAWNFVYTKWGILPGCGRQLRLDAAVLAGLGSASGEFSAGMGTSAGSALAAYQLTNYYEHGELYLFERLSHLLGSVLFKSEFLMSAQTVFLYAIRPGSGHIWWVSQLGRVLERKKKAVVPCCTAYENAVGCKLVTSLPTNGKICGEHFAVGRLVQLGTRQRAGPGVRNFKWCRSSASHCDQFTTKFEAPELTRSELNQNSEETDFEKSGIGVVLPFGVFLTDVK